MLKIILIVIAILVVLALICGAVGYYYMMRPAYRPGVLKARTDLAKFTQPPSQQGVEPGFWQVDKDTKIRYFSTGQGEPVLVIHGGPGVPTVKPWKGLDLTKGYRFYYYQQRGCGDSTRPFDKFTSSNYYQNMTTLIGKLGMEQQLADIERIRRLLKVDKLTIIGHSYGGFLATMYAVEFPESVNKLVLVAPAGVISLPTKTDGLDIVKKDLNAADKKAYDSWRSQYFDYGKIFTKNERQLAELNTKYFEFFIKAAKAKGTPVPAEVERGVDSKLVGGWSTHAIYLSLGQTYDYSNDVRKIKAKTLVVYGDRDVYPAKVYQEYLSLIPASKKSVMKTGHFCFDEDPTGFSRIITDFLPDTS